VYSVPANRALGRTAGLLAEDDLDALERRVAAQLAVTRAVLAVVTRGGDLAQHGHAADHPADTLPPDVLAAPA
jgi:hypothetical protein